MSQELHYTSVPRGLKPGSRGFGTVAATANLPESLADRLESLSVYQAVFPPGDPSAALNPVAYVHVKLTVGGHVHDVLSRIGPAGLDYSGRPNKYAHHVILEPAERPDGGPAWLLSQPGFVNDAWEGEPRILPDGTAVPRGDHPPGIAQAWRDLTGDAGWAGVLAESFLADMRRPVFVVFRPGIELLPLFVEAIALLPDARRWDVEFSTYLTTLPPGISCTWRGVLEGSPQAKSARRLPNALIVDLCRPMPSARGGGLVHLARTGERLDIPEAGASSFARASDEATRPVAVAAGPPHPPSAVRDRTADADHGRDRLPDLASQLAADGASLRGGRPRPRPRRLVAVVMWLTCLMPLVAGAFFLSPALRQRLGFERAQSTSTAGDRPPAVPDRPHSPAPLDTPPESPRVAEVPTPLPGSHKKDAEPVADANVAAPPPDATRPASTAPRPTAEPILLAFATPDVPRSSLGSPARQERAIQLPEDTDDRIEILNGPQFRLTPVPAPPHTWDVGTRTGSGLGGGFALARLNHADGNRWQFDWTKNAKAQSSPVEGFKDAVLALQSRGGRPIYVLLRGVERESARPMVVWKDQRILFDKLDPRIRSVEWGGHPDVLDGTRWKPQIRRWKAVLSRSEAEAADDDSPRRVIEPETAGDEKSSVAGPELERDLVPGEVKLKLTINPDKPGTIDVRIEPDLDRVRVGRDERSARLDELKKATPADRDGKERDPLAYRRDRLAKLRRDGARAQDEIKSLEKEIAELERINEIRGTEDLLNRKARLELSVVIGLDVEGPGILDIVRIGEFAGGR